VLLAASAAFFVVFGLFLAASAFLLIWIAVWAIRRDRAGRRRWLAEHEQQTSGDVDGHRPD
jgi:ABC-type nickel/cobalt efflux system permease component RcnA